MIAISLIGSSQRAGNTLFLNRSHILPYPRRIDERYRHSTHIKTDRYKITCGPCLIRNNGYRPFGNPIQQC